MTIPPSLKKRLELRTCSADSKLVKQCPLKDASLHAWQTTMKVIQLLLNKYVFFTCLHYKNLLEICHFPVCWQNNLKKKCILALSVFASPFSKLQSIMSEESRSVGLYLYSVTLYDLDRIFLKC